jgi:signal transduction histidine kinase
MWENRQALTGEKPLLLPTVAGPALILSRIESNGVSAAVASPSYLKSLCRSALAENGLECTLSDNDGHPIVGEASTGSLMATRPPTATLLPWTLQIFAEQAAAGASPQGRLLWWVAGVLTIIWFTGAAFIVRAIQREARVAQLQSDFLAAISHEFRSPLSSLCQISEMLEAERFDSDEMRRKSYGVLVRETGRLRSLVEDLLDFGRFESGASIYHFEPLEVGSFLKPIIADFQHQVAPDGYSIEFRESEKEIYVAADREALSRAIRNLLDNAVKYSPDCHTVWVELEREPDRVLIAVRDQGFGVPLAEQRRIFERFVRGAESKARRIKGTGVGLAMVRHIVQAHGGEIFLTSKPGEGSRFTMVLPEGVKS